MFWRYAKGSSLAELIRNLLRIFRQLLVVFDGDVEQSLEYLDEIARRYRLWRDDFGPGDFRRLLEERGEAAQVRGTLRLTPKGERALRRQMLQEVFAKVVRGGAGEHRTPEPGGAGEPGDETRGFEFGDPYDALDTNRTLHNWLQRTGGGGGHIEEADLEVREREFHTSCATVLLIDVSHSMTLYGEDRITPAKRVALALTELIQTRYPKDTIDVVLFGDEAKRVPLHRLPYISNGPFHTNTRAGLIAAQEILKRRKSANRQIIMLTDGKPSAIHEEGRLYKNPFGLDRKVVAKTLDEAARCRRKGIPITTFMLTSDPYLRGFVETFTETNRGRAYFAESNRLESFVLVDFLRNRRRRVR